MPRSGTGLAKLTRPRLHDAVVRERLFARLDDARDKRRAICVVGPPGAGKTTVVASWLDARGVRGIYQVVWKGDAKGGSCFKTFAMPDGKVFARCEGKPTATGWEGTVVLMGGTGRYAGTKGSGNYYFTNVSPSTSWDVLVWEYEIP